MSCTDKTLLLCGKSIKKTEKKYSRDSAPLYGMIQKWFNEICCGLTSRNYTEYPRCSYEITTKLDGCHVGSQLTNNGIMYHFRLY